METSGDFTRQVRAVIFDLDGTLVEFGSRYDQYLNVAHRHALTLFPCSVEQVATALKRIGGGFWLLNPSLAPFGARNAGLREVTRRAFWELGLNHLAEDLAFVEQFTDEYVRERGDSGVLRPEALSVLARLRQSGRKLGLLTNGSTHVQRRKVCRLGLEACFDIVQIEEAAGVGKPNTEAYTKIARELGEPSRNCCMVGDNYALDIAASKNIGMVSVYFHSNSESAPSPGVADKVITSLSELLTILVED